MPERAKNKDGAERREEFEARLARQNTDEVARLARGSARTRPRNWPAALVQGTVGVLLLALAIRLCLSDALIWAGLAALPGLLLVLRSATKGRFPFPVIVCFVAWLGLFWAWLWLLSVGPLASWAEMAIGFREDAIFYCIVLVAGSAALAIGLREGMKAGLSPRNSGTFGNFMDRLATTRAAFKALLVVSFIGVWLPLLCGWLWLLAQPWLSMARTAATCLCLLLRR